MWRKSAKWPNEAKERRKRKEGNRIREREIGGRKGKEPEERKNRIGRVEEKKGPRGKQNNIIGSKGQRSRREE